MGKEKGKRRRNEGNREPGKGNRGKKKKKRKKRKEKEEKKGTKTGNEGKTRGKQENKGKIKKKQKREKVKNVKKSISHTKMQAGIFSPEARTRNLTRTKKGYDGFYLQSGQFSITFRRTLKWKGRIFGWCISRGINRSMDSCKWNDYESSTTR